MAKILNLDALTLEATRELVLGGVTYPVPEMSVENFIETTRAAQAIPADATLADQVSATVDMIVRSVPNLKREILVGIPLSILSSIVAFVRGDDVPDQTDTSAADAAKPADTTQPADGAAAGN